MEAIEGTNNYGRTELDYKGARTAYDAEMERLMTPINNQIQATQAAMTRRT